LSNRGDAFDRQSRSEFADRVSSDLPTDECCAFAADEARRKKFVDSLIGASHFEFLQAVDSSSICV
jgi:hypothetical protein